MAEPEHYLDGISDDLFDWMNQEVEYHVEAMRGGYRSPFSADVSSKELHDYWTRQMFKQTPDGVVHYDQPNEVGRAKVIQQKGIQSYAEIYDTVKPKAGIRSPVDTSGSDPLKANVPPMPEDSQPVEPGP
jgi:hypothetical protein